MPRSTYYCARELDQLYMKRPFYGSRKMAVELGVNRKRIQLTSSGEIA